MSRKTIVLKPETVKRISREHKVEAGERSIELRRRLQESSQEARRTGRDDIYAEMLQEMNAQNSEKADRPANRKQWFTVGYVDRMASLVDDQFQNNPTHYHGYLADLLKQTLETLQGEYVRGAVCAVIWPGQLSRHTAIYGAHALPVHHVFPDGRITGSTG